MKLLLAVISLTALSASASASVTDSRLINHAENFVLAACPAAKSAVITDAKLVDQKTKQDHIVYTYDLTLKTDLQTYVTLRIVKDESKDNVQTISNDYLPKGCSEDNIVQTIECGDHWFSAQFKLNLRSNRAKVVLDGDSVRDSSEIEGKVNYLPENGRGLALDIQTRAEGESAVYNLELNNSFKQWTAEKDGIYLGFCK